MFLTALSPALWGQATFKGVVTTLGTGSATLSGPDGVAVDPAGDVLIADTGNNRIVKVDTTGAAAPVSIPGLNGPHEIALDNGGNLYIADTGNSRILMVTAAGAGTALATGSLTLIAPQGVVVDHAGNVFIADTGNNRIVEVSATGAASAYAITGLVSPTTLSSPRGLAFDTAGNLYLADAGNSRVVKVTSAGVGTTVPITGVVPANPVSVAVDALGKLYVADGTGNRVVAVTTSNVGTNFGAAYSLTLTAPASVAVDVFGNVYLANTGSNRVLSVQPSSAGFGHLQSGTITGATLALPIAVAAGTDLTNLTVNTQGTSGSDFTAAGNTTCTAGTYGSADTCILGVTLLPSAPGLRQGGVILGYQVGSTQYTLTVPVYGFADAPQAALSPGAASVMSTGAVTLPNPYQIAIDGSGDLYASSYSGDKIIKVPAAGGTATPVSIGNYPALSSVTGVAIDGAGDVFFSDYGNNLIYEVTPAGIVSQLTITAGSVRLSQPTALAADAAGNLFIADYGNSRIVRVRPPDVPQASSSASQSLTGNVVNTGDYAFQTGTVTGLTVDSNENVYIADRSSSRIVRVTSAGVASTVMIPGFTLSSPQGVAVDGMANLYIADSSNNRILELTSAGVASQVALQGLTGPSTIGTPFGVSIDPLGNLVIPDWTNGRIVKVNVSQASLSFASTNVGSTSSDSPQVATVTNLGNEPLVLSADPAYTSSFSENSAATNRCTSSTPLAAGAVCEVAVKFTPQVMGSLSANIAVTDNTLNATGSVQQVATTGTGLNPGDTTATSAAVTPATAVLGQTVSIAVHVVDTTSGHAAMVPTGTVSFTDTVGSTTVSLNGGTALSLSGGGAMLANLQLSGVGTHTIAANYTGVTGSFLASSNVASVVLNRAPVSVTGPTVEPVTITHGQAGSIAITVAGPYATIAPPSGTVTYTIVDTSNTIVVSSSAALTAAATASAATIPVASTLASGNYTVQVSYPGDTNYVASSVATTINLTIGQLTPAITWAQPVPIVYGTALGSALDATAQTSSSTVPGTFAYTATLAGGSATTVNPTIVLGAGSYTLRAIFTPSDTTTYTTVSASVSLLVSKQSITITWTPSAAISYGTNLSALLNATAAVGSTTVPGSFGYAATPTGGSSTAVTSSTVLAAGSYTLAATFNPIDRTDYAVGSRDSALVVSAAVPTLTLSASANPSGLSTPVTFAATISSAAGTPTGTVTFLDGSAVLGSGSITAGVASYSTSTLAIGSHSITAVYAGGGDFSAATSAAVTEVLQDFTFTVGSAGAGGATPTQTASPGETATFSLVFAPVGASPFPGEISLAVSGLPAGATANFTPSTIPAGAASTPVTLAVNLAAAAAARAVPTNRPWDQLPIVFGLVLLPGAWRLRRLAHRFGNRRGRRLIYLFLLGAAVGTSMLGLTGCSSRSNKHLVDTPQTYDLTITATSGAISHTTAVTLTVE